MGATNISIAACGSCGKQHGSVVLREFKKPRPPWSHWYECAETGDPVPCYVAQRDDRFVEANAKLCDAMVDAEMSGNLLGAIFRRKGKDLHMNRVCQTFSRDDFKQVVRDLQSDLEAEHGPPPEKELPPAAEPPRPAVQLFGDTK